MNSLAHHLPGDLAMTYRYPCKLAAMIIASVFAFAGSAQNKAERAELVTLMRSIPELRTTLDDDYERSYLHADVLAEAVLVAWLADDQRALALAAEQAKRLVERGDELEDGFIRDSARVSICLATAAMGDPAAAEQQARAIPMRTYRVQALGLLAAQRARAGDAEGFSRLASESATLLRATILADVLRASEEREMPSWVAWSNLNEWMGVAFFSGLFEPEAAKAELARLAKQLDAIPLEPGAKAEVYALLATGYAVLGDKPTAKAWLAKTEKPLKKEQTRVNKAEEDEFAWWYGTDAARVDMVRAYTMLEEHGAAADQIEHIDRLDMTLWCNAIIGGYARSKGQHDKAEPLLNQVAETLLQGDRVVRVALDGPRDAKEADVIQQLLQQEERWQDYNEFNLFWDSLFVGQDLTPANDKARLAGIKAALKSDHAKIGLELGMMKARLLPNPYERVGE